MRARRLTMLSLTLPALLLGSFAAASPALAAPCDTSTDTLGNGGFEDPPVTANTYTLFPAASVPPWQTTDGSGQIEIWGTGFLGVPAYAGNAFAELNANTPGTLYQDVLSIPGATMTWTLAHRGRDGDDEMEVLIGDANVADVLGSTGWDFNSGPLLDGNAAWGVHTGDYVVPAGQTCTRLAFRAVSSVGGDSYGNFLDEISFTTTAAPPTPAPTESPDGSVVAVTPPPTDAFTPVPAPDDLGWFGVVTLVAMTVAAGITVGGFRRSRQRP
jgi:hypothetical protein